MLIEMHGLVLECNTGSSELEAQLIRPFSLYQVEEGTPAVTIVVIEEALPYERYPSIEASFSTPRNVVYDSKSIKIVDYFGKGAVVEDKDKSLFTIFGTNSNFLQEAFYLLVISIFGQFCDRNRLLRVHAMALSYNDKAILLPMPPGLGKSTMAFAMLEEDGFKLISDDEPVVSASGSILPFALRIGTLDPKEIESVPKEYVYSIDRMEFGLKYFVDIAYWEEKLEHRALNEVIFVLARRVLNGPPSIKAVPKRKILKSLLRDAVIGVGLYQGLEFILSNSAWSTVSQIGTVYRRSVVAWKLLRNSQTYQMTLSRDIQANVQVFSDFIRKLP